MSKITKVRKVVNEMFGCHTSDRNCFYIYLDLLSNGYHSLKVDSWSDYDYDQCINTLTRLGCDVINKEYTRKDYSPYNAGTRKVRRLWIRDLDLVTSN